MVLYKQNICNLSTQVNPVKKNLKFIKNRRHFKPFNLSNTSEQTTNHITPKIFFFCLKHFTHILFDVQHMFQIFLKSLFSNLSNVSLLKNTQSLLAVTSELITNRYIIITICFMYFIIYNKL